MKFVKGQVYDFSFKELRLYGGKKYLMLTFGDEKATTLPGYENYFWRYRVEALDFQIWDESNIPDTITCFVAGFMKNSDGEETEFPVLRQDLGAILKQIYTPGEKYTFTVSERPGESFLADGKPTPYYLLSDAFGLKHQYKSSEDLEIGTSLELTVETIEGHWLKFANGLKNELKEYFEVGKNYLFSIESEEIDSSSGKPFYSLIDKTKGISHRFYFDGARTDGPGDEITLQVKAFLKNGWLLLKEPNKPLSDSEIAELEEIETISPRRENNVLEFKSSLIFTASGEKNIDKQLGREIMQQLASFMNAEGGCVYLGYKDDGTICGIENEVSELNTSEEDEYQYKPTLDGLQLKIRNTIVRHLGGFANSVTKIEFRKTPEDHMVCHIEVPPASKPIYQNGVYLYKRSGNMCQWLRGDDLTFFIMSRMKTQEQPTAIAIPIKPPALTVPEVTQEVTKEEMETVHTAPVPAAPTTITPERVWTHFTFYNDGSISRQSKAVITSDVLFDIPLSIEAKTKNARLLLCYDNGCVNIVNPKAVYSDKLSKSNQHYKNGWNTDAKLIHIYECSNEDYLVVRSKKPDGEQMIKAVWIGNYTVHSGLSMQTQGNRIVDPERATIVDMELVPGEQQSFISSIVLKSKSTAPGYPVQHFKYHGARAFLKHRKLAEMDTAHSIDLDH